MMPVWEGRGTWQLSRVRGTLPGSRHGGSRRGGTLLQVPALLLEDMHLPVQPRDPRVACRVLLHHGSLHLPEPRSGQRAKGKYSLLDMNGTHQVLAYADHNR